MRVFVAGASGVIGRALLPVLRSEGHDVVGMVRSTTGAAVVGGLGARVEQVDALDGPAVEQAVRRAEPDAVVHLLTAIPAEINPRRMAHDFAATNRLRSEGTRLLLGAADRAGVRRVITQGLASAYDPDQGPGLADEDTPFWRRPPAQFSANVDALRELEERTRAAGGLVLRIGHLYGSGSIYAADGSFARQVRAGKMALVGGGTSVFSFTHANDAATAIATALPADARGALNIVDDDPVPMSEWLPVFAGLAGARAPRSVPSFVARLLAGSWGVAYMTRLRGASNARAKTALGWQPTYASWRDGFAAELAAPFAVADRPGGNRPQRR